MSKSLKIFSDVSVRFPGNILKKQTLSSTLCLFRTYADIKKSDLTSKQLVVQGTENEERIRVRRARPTDGPRVLKFVLNNTKYGWSDIVTPTSGTQLILSDLVSRTLAQGNSMLAEQQTHRRGWTSIVGLALATTICPWDAIILEQWSRHIRCNRSRKLMHLVAHCMKAPALHDKYQLHRILQVTLVVPPNNKNREIITLLTKNAIQRGREAGFPLIRFDVSQDSVAKLLEELPMKKEWQLSNDVLGDKLKDTDADAAKNILKHEMGTEAAREKFLAVYTTFTSPKNREKK